MSLLFIGLVAAMFLVSIAAIAASTRSAVVAGPAFILLAGWLALTGWLASSGHLSDFSATPPLFLGLLAAGLFLAVSLARSLFGLALSFLPLWALVGVQAFRIAVELALHHGHEAGLVPVQMTFSGANFDIVSGLSALVLAPFAARVPRAILWIWNIVSLGLLLTIVTIAILSTPRFHLFAEPNRFAAQFPFIWLPTFLVPLALCGHLVMFRWLARKEAPMISARHRE